MIHAPVNTTCPNCGAAGMSAFYEVNRIPVHSCLMMADRQAAKDYPRRDLALGFCDRCGFISNVKFDAAAHEYSSQYEDQQSFSPRFRTFQTELIERLIRDYDIRGKDVVEVGCSKGDFLIELCERGDNRGIGIDPSAIPGRVTPKKDIQVEFIADLYSEAYTHLECDVLCCRHTLEHIHQTNAFVQMVRRAIGDRPDALVFFEVPDVGRVLKEQAFWDIYYEHCSYFSLGSLARVFRANCFDVAELAKDYDDQYLLIITRPVNRPTAARLPQEDDLDALRRDVAAFSAGVGHRLESWRERIRQAQSAGRRTAIWGSGSKCVSFLSTLGVDGAIDHIVDINPHRHGKFLAGSGREVSSPQVLRTSRPDVVFIMNPIYREEIRQACDAMGIQPELIAI